MAHESFENPQIALMLNENFVCIKVDREERPDIDAVYMRFCQALTGSGGWPLTIVMTPDKKPFFAATYIPPTTRGNRPGMIELIPRIADAWKERCDDILKSAQDIVNTVNPPHNPHSPVDLDAALLTQAFNGLCESFDTANGGFGHAPKFPTPHTLLFLLRYWKRTGSDAALSMATATLSAMRRGGIYDHVGYGFHRYSTDPYWFLPHFEKMLYDQAMLLWAYTEGYLATGNEEFAATAREIAAFVLRNLSSPEGGFYCAFDADDEGGEGAYYQWTHAEMTAVLDRAELLLAEELCGVKKQGNVHDEATGNATGTNIVFLEHSLQNYAAHSGLSVQEVSSRFDSLRRKLFRQRKDRTPPGRDEKILTDWNALMFGALALAGRVLNEDSFIAAAERAADYILRTLYREGSGLLHRYCKGEAGITAHLDDYSFMIWGLMELYQAGFKEHYLLKAIELQDELCAHYSDERSGAFFSTHANANDLPLRPLEFHDGAIPSGNSVAMLNLLRLGSITGRPDFEDRAQRIGRAFGAQAHRMPEAFCMLMCALEFETGPRPTIVIAGTRNAPDTQELLRVVNIHFLPDTCVLLHAQDRDCEALATHMPGNELKPPVNNRAAAYVCCNNTCLPPVCDAKSLKKKLNL
jgi:uncharacterized protein YyaL (SSP411 family)